MYHGYITGAEGAALATGLIMVVTVWRIPTLVYALRHFQEVKAELMGKASGEMSKEAKEVFGTNSEILSYAAGIVFFFKHWMLDLPYIPLYLLGCLAPWRAIAWTAAMLNEPFVNDKQVQHRHRIVHNLKGGLKDWLSLIGCLFVLCTLWRLPFLYFILKRNNHFFGDPQAPKSSNRLSVKHCVIRTLKEFIKDILFIPFALLLVVATPWRIPNIVRVFTSFSMNFPRNNDFGPLMKQRVELLKMALGKFILDYVVIVTMALLIITGWRAVTAIKLFIYHVKRVWQGTTPTRSLAAKMLHQVLQLGIDLLMGVLFVLTVLSLIRVREFYIR